MLIVLRILLWVLCTLYYSLESLVLALTPRDYKRKNIRGSVALVTGGGSGIGRLMCLKLASKGAIVVTWDVSDTGNSETMRLVKAAGGQCRGYTVDLCDRQAVYAAAAKVKQEVGKVDILINNAGVVTGKSFLDSPDNSIVLTFNVNAISHFWTTKAFLPDMMTKNKGHVVTIASMAGKMPCNGLVDYCSSKYAAVGFHETLTAELKANKKHGVKTTCVCPMVISTGMFKGAVAKYFPTLEPNWVADEIVDAMLMNTHTLYLPSYMWIILLQAILLPQKSLDYLGDIFEFGDVMKNFVGRTKKN